ncbi:MAG: OmpA family protein [Crocinitomicaceae bacterium]|nr:OmpA family protein [Crocinitomicaceae bacterium]
MSSQYDRETISFELNDSTFSNGSTYRVVDRLFKYDILELETSSFAILDSIAAFLIQHTKIVVEIRTHTNDNGDAYSNNLSGKRAHVIYKYLLEKGIDSERLIPKGYGAENPVYSSEEMEHLTEAQLEEAKLYNRRTDFLIIAGGTAP